MMIGAVTAAYQPTINVNRVDLATVEDPDRELQLSLQEAARGGG